MEREGIPRGPTGATIVALALDLTIGKWAPSVPDLVIYGLWGFVGLFGVRSLYGHQPFQEWSGPKKVTLAALAFAACVASAALAHRVLGHEYDRPQFEFALPALISANDTKDNNTFVAMNISIWNQGAPSAVMGWRIKYVAPDTTFDLHPHQLTGPVTLPTPHRLYIVGEEEN